MFKARVPAGGKVKAAVKSGGRGAITVAHRGHHQSLDKGSGEGEGRGGISGVHSVGWVLGYQR